jgi:hypothetical protein
MNRMQAIVEIQIADDGEHCAGSCHYGVDENCSLVPDAVGRTISRERDPFGRNPDGVYYRCRSCLAAERARKVT